MKRGSVIPWSDLPSLTGIRGARIIANLWYLTGMWLREVWPLIYVRKTLNTRLKTFSIGGRSSSVLPWQVLSLWPRASRHWTDFHQSHCYWLLWTLCFFALYSGSFVPFSWNQTQSLITGPITLINEWQVSIDYSFLVCINLIANIYLY